MTPKERLAWRAIKHSLHLHGIPLYRFSPGDIEETIVLLVNSVSTINLLRIIRDRS